MQSGSDEVLKLMRRRYDTALFASKVKKIKEVMPDAFIGVDVIVGTRGETEEYLISYLYQNCTFKCCLIFVKISQTDIDYLIIQ